MTPDLLQSMIIPVAIPVPPPELFERVIGEPPTLFARMIALSIEPRCWETDELALCIRQVGLEPENKNCLHAAFAPETGLAAFRAYLDHPAVRLVISGFGLGGADDLCESASGAYWLIIDRQTRQAMVAPPHAATQLLLQAGCGIVDKNLGSGGHSGCGGGDSGGDRPIAEQVYRDPHDDLASMIAWLDRTAYAARARRLMQTEVAA